MKANQSKHLLFYGGVILLVLALFRFTSAYGEANLKPPPNLNGRYLTVEPPPGCPPASRLAITIQQSGIYLSGALELQDEMTTAVQQPIQPEQLTLNGRWQQQATLSGQTNAFATCQIKATEATLQGTVSQIPEATLTGQLVLNGFQPWQFTAKRDKISAKQGKH